MKTRTHHRSAFTLVELLVVIAIIGLLVGLLIPAVMFAMRTVRQNAIVMEVVTISDAVNKYQQKYGDYPPDGSSATVLRRHLLKAFPQMASSEFADLAFAVKCNQPKPNIPEFRVMDPGEALVFFLGGFSKDSVHPLTGPGGPLNVLARNNQGQATSIEYRVDRESPFYEFKQSQLTLEVVNGITISTDEVLYNANQPNMGFPPGVTRATEPDVIPCYQLSGQEAPFIYFDSRTYVQSNGYTANFSPDGQSNATGYARPYLSTDVNTTVRPQVGKYYRFSNPKTFQVIHAGLDDDFGGLAPTQQYASTFYAFPTGQLIDITIPGDRMQTGPAGYQRPDGDVSAQLDNATNFSDGILGDKL